jgi:hypothetical protein
MKFIEPFLRKMPFKEIGPEILAKTLKNSRKNPKKCAIDSFQ